MLKMSFERIWRSYWFKLLRKQENRFRMKSLKQFGVRLLAGVNRLIPYYHERLLHMKAEKWMKHCPSLKKHGQSLRAKTH
uniref:Uncharacterized protein n=1 Tax=Candidatus Methanogaster sp. ANME-2c ERB4 TaxID=2759911 RepID=A0A7G9Y9N0_9EURY|nr:hypothetical protein LCOPCFJD_00013 [Methanosarcinales archaeon ANME-2c ERB4]